MCLWKSLKISSFPVFGFSDGAALAFGGAKDGPKKEKLYFGGPRLGGCDTLSLI